MLSRTTGRAPSNSEMEVKNECLPRLWLRLRVQTVLLLRRLIRTAARVWLADKNEARHLHRWRAF